MNIDTRAVLPPFRSPAFALGLASVAAALLLSGNPVANVAALALVLVVILMTVATPWLGILALFPLVIPIAAPAEAAGLREVAFALLTMAVLFRSMLGAIVREGLGSIVKQFGIPVLISLSLLVVNFLAAHNVGTSLHDWIRGVLPYVFLVMALPIALEMRGDMQRVRWLGIAIGIAVMLHCAQVLGYYLVHRMWEYQWYLKIDGVLTRVPEAVAKADPEHMLGPFIERITMKLPSSTDALIPLGVSFGFVIAVIAPNTRARLFGIALAAIALPAILVTYTRSMMLSPLLVIFAFCLYLVLFRRQPLKFAMLLLLGFAVYAVTVIFLLGLELAWLNRVMILIDAVRQSIGGLLSHFGSAGSGDDLFSGATHGAMAALPSSPGTADDNVTTRIEEYRIAWSMFLDHPIIGNGLGTRHEISFVRSTGDVIRQSVGYIHNWPLYMLMAAGLMGFAAYAILLIGPLFVRLRAGRNIVLEDLLLRVMQATLAIYGLFFAVARLITFNLLIAAAWGILLAIAAGPLRPSSKKKRELANMAR